MGQGCSLCLIEGCSRPYDGTVFICLSAHVCYCVRDLSVNDKIVLFKKFHSAPKFFLCSYFFHLGASVLLVKKLSVQP